MNSRTTPVYLLLVSAFVLSALLIGRIADARHADSQTVNIVNPFESPAYGEMVVSKDIFTMLSTRATTDSEVVYLLDNRNEVLIAYMVNPNSQRIEAVAQLAIGDLFTRGLNSAGGGRGGGRSTR